MGPFQHFKSIIVKEIKDDAQIRNKIWQTALRLY